MVIRTDRQTDGQTDGRTDRQTDRRTDAGNDNTPPALGPRGKNGVTEVRLLIDARHFITLSHT